MVLKQLLDNLPPSEPYFDLKTSHLGNVNEQRLAHLNIFHGLDSLAMTNRRYWGYGKFFVYECHTPSANNKRMWK
jgi:hypothetical protein